MHFGKCWSCVTRNAKERCVQKANGGDLQCLRRPTVSDQRECGEGIGRRCTAKGCCRVAREEKRTGYGGGELIDNDVVDSQRIAQADE